jgi:hypothetical protein
MKTVRTLSYLDLISAYANWQNTPVLQSDESLLKGI